MIALYNISALYVLAPILLTRADPAGTMAFKNYPLNLTKSKNAGASSYALLKFWELLLDGNAIRFTAPESWSTFYFY